MRQESSKEKLVVAEHRTDTEFDRPKQYQKLVRDPTEKQQKLRKIQISSIWKLFIPKNHELKRQTPHEERLGPVRMANINIKQMI